MGCCHSCRCRKSKSASEPEPASHYIYSSDPIPEKNHIPFTDMQMQMTGSEDISIVPPANGNIKDGQSTIGSTKPRGSNLSLAKRSSAFYRLSKLGSDFSIGESIRTDGSTWTVASSVNEPKEVDDPNYAADVLTKLNRFRHAKKYTDFTIYVGDLTFRCHKVVLSATSRFFALNICDEVTEEGGIIIKHDMTLNDIRPDVVGLLLDYIYTARLMISSENVSDLLTAAQCFYLHSAEQACQEFLERQDNRSRHSITDSSKIMAEYTFEQPYHVNEILLGLNDQRFDNKFVDVTLCAGEEELPCHKVVLATIDSAMEERLQTADENGHVKITDVSAAVMRMIVNYTYTSKLEVCEENAKEALVLASTLRHDSAVRKCSEFLKTMLDPSNCLSIQRSASGPSCELLHKVATKFALKNFREVIKYEEFLELSRQELVEYLGDDNLNLLSEEEAYKALIKWVKHDLEARKNLLGFVLKSIRLPYSSPKVLDAVAEDPLVKECEGCHDLILEARAIHILIRDGKQMFDPRMKPRKAFADVTFVVGGRNKNQQWIPDTSYYDNIRRKWFPLEAFPGSNTEYKVVALCNDVYVISGRYREGQLCGNVWRYNSLFDEWTEVAPIHLPRVAHGVGVLQDLIYVVGGRVDKSNEPLHEVERYCRQTNQWKKSESMTYGVLNPVVTSHSRRLYVVGGLSEEGQVLVQCFHLDKNAWTVIKDVSLPFEPRFGATVKSKIYLVGGKTEYQVQVYNPNKGEDKMIGEMQHAEGHARELYSATVTNRKIDVTGGQWTVGTVEDALTIATNSVEQYDPITNEWTVLGPMPRALTYHGCVTIKMYIGLPKGTDSWLNNKKSYQIGRK
ncbi:kelch-like protein 24 [Acanthaster planci]|uniref:Kelch-like protein 24 n=1 Tax=Acanthaster planci TaxID=133434 RepID=A0A8B7ZQW6_ACAPL|nr:kelch-like protein 24 [Acanthaster planci]XP_022107961.1 kelch-like protein 24 [Acanthaster planci]XP_022107962.1 kelch-like protein 24 [Acanthaster planci]XP_022107963.1 kelch-like protein 24 [Acanthaster planci]